MITTKAEVKWHDAAQEKMFIPGCGIAVKINDKQIAVFKLSEKGDWHASDNRCPHKGDMVIARGLTACKTGEPAVACPMHKKVFSLITGECLSEDGYSINIYPVRVQDGMVQVGLA